MRDKERWVAYVGPFRFPWGQPGSRRVLGIALSIAHSGRGVMILSGEHGPDRAEQVQALNGTSINHVGVAELHDPSASQLNKARTVYFEWGKRTVLWLERQTTLPSHVIVYGGACQYMARLMAWCRRKGVALIADVADWYGPRQLSGGRFGPSYVSVEIARRYHYPRCDGIIAISSFISDYHRQRGRVVVTVPPTLDVDRIHLGLRPPTPKYRLTLAYCGSPGVKDSLSAIMQGVEDADPSHSQLRLVIAGPSSDEVSLMRGGTALPPNIVAVGRIPQTDVGTLLQSADFSVLLRKPARFTNAGFPTKFVESMANGTPVIFNYTSDLAAHSADGKDSLICSDETSESLRDVLCMALSMPAKEIAAMRYRARQRAMKSFHYSVYSSQLENFLSETEIP